MISTDHLKRQINLTERLYALVKTMKTLAAVGIRENEHSIASVNAYYQTIKTGLHVYLRNTRFPLPIPPHTETGKTALVIFGSDQGLCGQFNERITEFVLQSLDPLDLSPDACPVLVVGSRLVASLEDNRFPVAACLSLPVTSRGFEWALQKLLLEIDALEEKEKIHRFLLFHNRPLGSANYESRQSSLLPFDVEWIHDLKGRPWPNRCLPTFSQDRERLFSTLVRHYLTVQLSRAMAESLMSENVSRMAAMQLAEKNIEERMEQLNRQYQEMRQTGITDELLDIVSGFEAITQNQRKHLHASDYSEL